MNSIKHEEIYTSPFFITHIVWCLFNLDKQIILSIIMNQIRMSQYQIFGKEMSLEFINKKLNSDPKNSLADSRKKITKFSDLKQTRCFICGSKRGKLENSDYCSRALESNYVDGCVLMC